MTAQSIVCGACAAEVPFGRLSCPACGDLLAAVARGRRKGTSSARRAQPDLVRDPIEAPMPADVEPAVATRANARDANAELPWPSATATSDPHPVTPPAADEDDDRDEPMTAPTGGAPATSAPSWAVAASAVAGPAVSGLPEPSVSARPAPTRPAPTRPVPATGSTPSFAGPGAYVPPVPSTAPRPAAVPARAWAGQRPEASAVGAAQAPSPAAAPSVDRPDNGARLAEFVGWLSVAGATLAAVGFLLPWGVVVIGSSGVGYFDRWGLAGPAHVVVVVGLLAVIALALIRNAIPVWARTGLPGLGLGALLLGLVWPYLLGPLGSGPGALIVVVGALALAMSGILALVADRHSAVERSV